MKEDYGVQSKEIYVIIITIVKLFIHATNVVNHTVA